MIAAQSCKYTTITGINAAGDHLLLTPNFLTTATTLSYEIEYDPNLTSAELKTCSPTPDSIDDGGTKFNLIVIDAQ